MKRRWIHTASLLILAICSGSVVDAKTAPRYTNALIHEESPYLRQHAHNPVHWMPWGEAAFKKARAEHKLIFLSIGYSTCHWCHVMEHESFEDPKLAAILNRYFVPIKVDREEHPQIDRHYQNVHRFITRRAGGWPLTLLLTPERKPFFAATYLPKEERYNQPGLMDLLSYTGELWRKNPAKITKIAEEIDRGLKRLKRGERVGQTRAAGVDWARSFVQAAAAAYDPQYGGFGREPKFPRPTTLTALLQIYRLTGNRRALKMATHTLEAMARGGIYDQIEGGFFRYSTDRKWRIPHFEKMLYTNAELIEAYALAWRITRKPLFARVVRETVSLLNRRYRFKGLYFGASDADSFNPNRGKEEEGYYYTYTYDEALRALEKAKVPRPKRALERFGITKDGNFIRFRSHAYLRSSASPDPRVRRALASLRSRRRYPFVDRKMLTAWNALMAHALFCASVIDPRYAAMGRRTLEKILSGLKLGKRLYHQKLPGRAPKVPALLEDYALTAGALIDAYEYGGYRDRDLEEARNILETVQKRFKKKGRYYDSDGRFANVLDLSGGSYRNPLAVLADAMMRLAALKERLRWQSEARRILRPAGRILDRYPLAAPMAVLDLLALKHGYVIVKAPRKRLGPLRRKLERSLSYPFVLFRPVNDALFQACYVDRCFLYDRSAKAFVDRLSRTLSRDGH